MDQDTKSVLIQLQDQNWDNNLDAQFHAMWGYAEEAIRWQEWSAECYRRIQQLRGF